ncbi:branched-chain amino acid ABC transporter substrate-binding protein [Bacillus thuringiensis]|uniref:branched-chain amino acid ABC transporter substrate-binding protein n=1 Tax=Bacillus TaxID=1386 RepID=UPI00077A36BE|nr:MULTISPECIES: branched-chain amino acid ABC transporter substrate-binding protein [Bacillus]KXY57192.1 hypothetical protein AT261_18810 [Bacillus cereus]KAB2373250.1 ABC transporter substrate-binding protein [Bacillus sp. RM2(2019)]PEY76911.1 hypothetical protein CN355_00810 [Bacillus thuringiensis]PFC49826.1 hypothetical protein CN300_00920 [Bacillus thuringiensis]PFJ09982.1 hypothetical protein COI87_20375 [Bacillus thuringiensis]
MVIHNNESNFYELLILPEQDKNLPSFRLGLSGNKGFHTYELCFGSLLSIHDWIKDNPSHKIELFWEDDSILGINDIPAAERLVNKGVQAVIGHLSSTEALRAAPIYDVNDILYLAPASTEPSLTEKEYNNVLRICGKDNYLAEKIADFILDFNGTNKYVSIIWEDIIHGRSLSNQVEKYLAKKKGCTILKQKWDVQINFNELNIKRSNIIFFAGIYQSALEFLRKLKEVDYRGIIILGDDCFIDEFAKELKNNNENLYVVSTGRNMNDSYYDNFSENYKNISGTQVGAYSITSYVATSLLLSTLPILQRNGIKECISTIRSLLRTNCTLLGNIQLDDRGDLENFPWDVYQIKSSEFIPVTLKEGSF